MNSEIIDTIEITRNYYLLENDENYKLLVLYALKKLNNDIKQKILNILINEEIVAELEEISHLMNKIEEWKYIQNKIQLQEYLLQQNIEVYMEKQDDNYREFLKYAINNIKQLQKEHERSDLVYEQVFNKRKRP